MAPVLRTVYASKVYASKCYTSFKWKLEEYSILQSYYSKFIRSPEFELAGTDKKCLLGYQHVNEHAYVRVLFPHDVTFKALKIVVSMIDEYDRKILTHFSIVDKPLQAAENKSFTTFDHPLLAADEMLKKEGILHNDTLTLFCEITIIKSVQKSSIEIIEPTRRLDDIMRGKCAEYLNKGTLCDVTFHIDDVEFHAHKVILAANSPVFEAMFSTPMTEQLKNMVEITDTDANTFGAFLKCLYTENIDTMEKHVGDIMILADKYQVERTKNLCENYIISHLDRDNVIHYLLLAYRHGFECLKTRALFIARIRQTELADSSDFDKLCVYPDLVAKIFCKLFDK